jgi:ABC-type branched-subunit amino acid transport system substrate-binding protein
MNIPSRGVTDKEIRFGISAPFSGATKELGHHMKLGIEAAFDAVNAVGGVHGRQLTLVAADDGYEPARTSETMKQLYERDQVFGLIGNVGTPTAAVALPYALDHKMLFYGAFTGASLLRRDPPDRYVFNYRASYAEETDAVVRYLVKLRRLRPEQIAVFAQQDAYGDAGFDGVAKAMRALRGGDEGMIQRLNYKRNTVDVDDAIAQLHKSRIPIKAIVMVATYRAAAKFIEKTRDQYPAMIYTNVSFVGSTALADELMLLGPRFATGVIVTQVVPAVEGHSSVTLEYKSALATYFPGEAPDYVSLEGYLSARILVEALNRAGPQIDTERVVEALESLHDFDIGLGATLSFSRAEHQGVHKVWGTQLDANGHYQPIELQ